jgi:hypothetical protein
MVLQQEAVGSISRLLYILPLFVLPKADDFAESRSLFHNAIIVFPVEIQIKMDLDFIG